MHDEYRLLHCFAVPWHALRLLRQRSALLLHNMLLLLCRLRLLRDHQSLLLLRCLPLLQHRRMRPPRFVHLRLIRPLCLLQLHSLHLRHVPLPCKLRIHFPLHPLHILDRDIHLDDLQLPPLRSRLRDLLLMRHHAQPCDPAPWMIYCRRTDVHAPALVCGAVGVEGCVADDAVAAETAVAYTAV